MKPIRILHVITSLQLGGAELSLRTLAARMDRRRFTTVVVSLTSGGEVAEMLRDDGIDVHSLELRRGIPDPRGIVRLRRLIHEYRPHLIQSWLYHADLLSTIAGPFSGAPLLWNVRCSNMDLTRYSWLSTMSLRALSKLSRRPRAIVTNSRAGLELHESVGYTPREWELIPNGFDTERFRPDPDAAARLRQELGVAPHTPLIGLIARYDPMKDHETFLEAARLVGRDDVHYVLAGSGIDASNAELRKAVESRGLAARCHLLGPRRDVPAINAALDIACSSSISEGFSNSIGEAMSCGTACVVTDVGDSAWLVGESGEVVPPGDAAAFAAALQRLLDSGAEELRRRGAAARKRIEEHFGIDAVVTRYETLYERVAAL